jgi:hypothetical protein
MVQLAVPDIHGAVRNGLTLLSTSFCHIQQNMMMYETWRGCWSVQSCLTTRQQIKKDLSYLPSFLWRRFKKGTIEKRK